MAQVIHALGAQFRDQALVTRLLDSGAEFADEIIKVEGFRAGIKDLSGMEACVNVEEVDLHQNEIADVRPLMGLQHLRVLHLGINQVSTAAPFGSMPLLEHLTLFQNDIEDVRPLGGMIQLQALHLRYNLLEDISPLADLIELRELTFGNNAISDVGCVEMLTELEVLNGYFNFIEDVSPLVTLKKLKWLYLGYNRITDIEPLFELDSLLDVHLEGNDGIPRSHVEELQKFLAARRAEQLKPATPVLPADDEDSFIQAAGAIPDRVKRQRAARARLRAR